VRPSDWKAGPPGLLACPKAAVGVSSFRANCFLFLVLTPLDGVLLLGSALGPMGIAPHGIVLVAGGSIVVLVISESGLGVAEDICPVDCGVGVLVPAAALKNAWSLFPAGGPASVAAPP
jgi:hypothetical protein